MLKPWTRMAESGLFLIDSAMNAVGFAVGTLTGREPDKTLTEPPLNGPRNIDEATADFAVRLAIIARSASANPSAWENAWEDVMAAALTSYGSIEPKSLREWMALPVQLPLSFGGLLTQSSLRGLHGLNVVGLEKLPALAFYAVEFYTDLEIFVTLQYKEYVAQLVEQVRQSPHDARKRMLLGRTYTKLGRYEDATRELAEAARDLDVRPAALQESLVANVRAGKFSLAVADGAASLALKPSSDKTRFWLWLAAQKLGGYPPEVPEDLRMEVKVGHHPTKVQFEDVAQKIGLDKTSGGRGSAVFDMDGDGYLDVVMACAHAGCSLYRNNGDGTFTDVTVGSGLDECVNTFAVTVGDYNNDGLDDLYITRLGFYPGESVLYRNNGDGTFTDVTKEAGVQNWGATFTAQWVDYDCDGFLDLFVSGNQGRFFGRNTPNRLYHNNGDGTFTDVSREAGIDEISLGFISLWCDYDDDGWLDLIQFVWSPEDDVLHNLIHGERPANGHPLRLYHNNGDGTFTLKSEELGLNECWGTMTGNAGDFNNDGYLDLILGNGGPLMEATEPTVLLEYDGAGKFHNVTFAAGLPFSGKGHGANMADLVGDGRLCLIMASGGLYPGDLLTTSVFRPKTLPGNYLNVRLVGTKSNRNAVGARLKLEAGGRSQHRLVSAGSGFGCLPYEQHFGLGKIGHVESLEILWPSRLKQRVENLPINNTIQIVEGESGWSEVYANKVKRGQAADREPDSVEAATVNSR